jgi:hypothetical protein
LEKIGPKQVGMKISPRREIDGWQNPCQLAREFGTIPKSTVRRLALKMC